MKKTLIFPVAVVALLSGCVNTSPLSGNVYTNTQAGAVQSVAYGTITSIRQVKIQANASDNNSTSGILGTIGGGVLGGMLGHTIGGGTGNKIATTVGAIAGVAAGSAVENTLSQANGLEIEIRLNEGGSVVIVQKAKTNEFYVGQPIRIIGSGKSATVAPR